jgi:hypothetical protein
MDAAHRFEIRITQRQAWYYFSLTDRQTNFVYHGGKGYNAKGGAKEAAVMLADSITDEFNEEVYDYGPLM